MRGLDPRLRRLFYIGLLPLLASHTLRAILGMLTSLIFLSVFRELQPYRSAVNNYIASTAQVTLSPAILDMRSSVFPLLL